MTVESYWQLAKDWQAAGVGHHAYRCPCLACADLRSYQRRVPLPVVIAGRTFVVRSLVRRP